jgi:hypothetical protein
MQCEYTHVNHPCKSCRDKKLDCGEKVFKERIQTMDDGQQIEQTNWTRAGYPLIPRTISRTGANVLEPSETIYLQYYWEMLFPSLSIVFNERSDALPSDIYILRRFGIDLSSNAVRHAILAYSYGVKDGAPNRGSYNALYHLTMAYEYTREAIDSAGFADLMYACYFMIKSLSFWCVVENERQYYVERLRHAKAFLMSVRQLMATTPPESDELHSITYIWGQILYTVSDCLLPVHCDQHYQEQCAELLVELLHLSESVMPTANNSRDFLETPFGSLQLVLLLRELKISLDAWHLFNAAHLTNSIVHSLAKVMNNRLCLLNAILSQGASFRPTFLDYHLPAALTYELVLYNLFLLEYVILVEPSTEVSGQQPLYNQAMDVVVNIARTLREKECTLPNLSLWVLFLAGLLLHYTEHGKQLFLVL